MSVTCVNLGRQYDPDLWKGRGSLSPQKNSVQLTTTNTELALISLTEERAKQVT